MSPYTFFVDRALGKSVGLALQGAGYNIEFHNAHFQPDCPDIEWLPVVSQREWIVLTKDNRISVNLSEILAIANHQARVFIILNTLVQNYALSVQGFSCYTFLELDIVQNLTVRKSRLSNILKFGIG